MKAQQKKTLRLRRRKMHVRKKVTGNAERPRMVVHRSLSHIQVQIIDDTVGKTLAAVSTTQSKLKGSLKSTVNTQAAKAVGKEIAEVALSRGIKNVCFDRGGRKYHGRVKALADAAREAGLSF